MTLLASTGNPEVKDLSHAAPRIQAAPTVTSEPMPRPAQAGSAAKGTRSDVAMRDWEDLFSAVESRLRQAAGDLLAATPGPCLPEAASQAQTTVLECVGALDQLHTTMKHELARREQLEMEVFDARTALAQARAELIGTRTDERRARRLALHDSLTELPNRSFFREWVDHALAHTGPQRQSLAVLYLDLDGFKPINDTHGHDTGDALLRIVAARLTRAVRAEDMVGRMGGDEFACLLGGLATRELLTQMACKLFDAVSAPIQIDDLNITVRPSIGVASCLAGGTSADALLKCADAAMYRAKRQQTGYAFCDECADEPTRPTE